MKPKANDTAMTRFDIRLSVKQKTIYQRAAELEGFRSLTDFVLKTVQKAADAIIEKHNATLTSKKDQEIFFNALMSDIEPNSKLKAAAEKYRKELLGK